MFVKSFFKTLIRQGILSRPPIEDLSIKKENNDRERFLNEQEVNLFFEKSLQKHKNLWLFCQMALIGHTFKYRMGAFGFNPK